MRSLIACSAIALGIACSTAAAQDIQRDILAGHITGPSGAVAGALVSVTIVDTTTSHAPLVARTDVEGRWLVAVQEGTGNYIVRVTAIGMKPAQATAKRGEPRKPIIVDIRMEAAAVSLDAVRVTEARRPRPPRDNGAPERVGSDRPIDGFAGAIAVGDQGNLAAMASSVPGVTLVPDASGGLPGFSGARPFARPESRHAERPVVRRRRHSSRCPRDDARRVDVVSTCRAADSAAGSCL
jgi:hypothetical protein